MGPDVILNTNMHKNFGSYNGSLTQSMHHTENTNIILITMMKQILHPLRARVKENHGRLSQRHSIKPQPTCESFMKIESEVRTAAVQLKSKAKLSTIIGNVCAYWACSLPRNIWVISFSFITVNKFLNCSEKLDFPIQCDYSIARN